LNLCDSSYHDDLFVGIVIGLSRYTLVNKAKRPDRRSFMKTVLVIFWKNHCHVECSFSMTY